MNKLQQAVFEILKDFDRFCRANDIQYQLYAGTLLGAIRHKGFIPWDDDIDVCMTRAEFEKFLLKYDNSNQKNQLYHAFNTKNYFLTHAKIRNNSVHIEANIPKSQTSRFGPWIDIFVFDNIPNGKEDQKDHVKQVRKVNNLLRFFLFTIYTDEKSIKNRIKKMVSKTNDKLMKAYFFIPKLIKKRHKLMTKYNHQQTDFLTIPGFYKYYNEYITTFLSKESFIDLTIGKFESNYFPIPKTMMNV